MHAPVYGMYLIYAADYTSTGASNAIIVPPSPPGRVIVAETALEGHHWHDIVAFDRSCKYHTVAMAMCGQQTL